MSWMMRQSCRASPGGSTALVDLDHPPLGAGRRSPRPPPAGAGQHDVGVPGRLAEEEVDGDEELQLLQHPGDEAVVRQRHLGVEAEAEQALDLALVDLAEQLVGVHTRVGDALLRHVPDAGDVGAMLGVLDVAHAGELVALLAVLAAALAVGLAGDGAVAAALAADAPRCQHDVDRPQAVLHAVAVSARCRGRASGNWSSPCPTTRPPAGRPAR